MPSILLYQALRQPRERSSFVYRLFKRAGPTQLFHEIVFIKL